MKGEPANILVIGRGGREHALALFLARDYSVERVWVAPGNGGTASMGGKVENIALDEDDFVGLIDFAHREHVSLIVVGPEAPLAAGIVDRFTQSGIACFGPTKAAARLEASKVFAKDFMRRHSIPTAQYAAFRNLDLALAHLQSIDYPVVIKASGLAAGKGVVLPATAREAKDTLRDILDGRIFGSAGDEVLIEQRISGPEASVLAFCDGRDFAVMPVAQDHKRVFDNDQGPNTGGMGAYAPAPIVSSELLGEIEKAIIEPTLAGMSAEGHPFAGVLYAGLMLTKDGPRVIEYNCRFGDPETQVILPLLETGLTAILMACATGTLANVTPRWRPGAALTVVAASAGYPGPYAKGHVISGLEDLPAPGNTLAFHAGTRLGKDERVLTDGGRVLAVTGLGENLRAAHDRAYAAVAGLHFEGMHYRRDIGANAL